MRYHTLNLIHAFKNYKENLKKFSFEKVWFLRKKWVLKVKLIKTKKKLFFNIFSTPKDSRAFRMFWLSKECKKNRWNRIVLITVIKTLKWLYWITANTLFSRTKKKEKKNWSPLFSQKWRFFEREFFRNFFITLERVYQI